MAALADMIEAAARLRTTIERFIDFSSRKKQTLPDALNTADSAGTPRTSAPLKSGRFAVFVPSFPFNTTEPLLSNPK
jgi:hypothetical protein